MAERFRQRISQWFDFSGSGWVGHDPLMKPTADRPYEVIAKEYGWTV